MGYTPHILVIGGGVVGTGIARDFAIRGLDVTLAERDTLAGGTTEHGQHFLDSGARVASSNQALAKRCLVETRTLASVAGGCIQQTDGLLVSDRDESGASLDDYLSACEECAIPVEQLDGETLRKREPSIAREIEHGLSVPDAVVDPVALTLANARAAKQHGANIRTQTSVTEITVEDGAVDTVTLTYDPVPVGYETEQPAQNALADGGISRTANDSPGGGGRPGGPSRHGNPGEKRRTGGPGAAEHGRSRIADHLGDQISTPGEMSYQGLERRTEEIEPDYVVNAAGPWVGAVAALASIDLPLAYTARTQLALAGDPISRPVTHCDGHETAHTITPGRETTLLGATARRVENPDGAVGTCDEVDLLLEALTPVVPTVQHCRPLRTACGVRARADAQGDTSIQKRTIGAGTPHEFTVLDHGDRDNCWGLTTVIGGSPTLHRFIAERVVDEVCDKFGITRDCQTDELALPDSEQRDSETSMVDPVLCECQSVTRSEVRSFITDESATETDMQELRLRTGAAEGECQGGRCAHRLAGQLSLNYDTEMIETTLSNLLAERWAGQRPVLWGAQLGQAMRLYQFHTVTLNRKWHGMLSFGTETADTADDSTGDTADETTDETVSADEPIETPEDKETLRKEMAAEIKEEIKEEVTEGEIDDEEIPIDDDEIPISEEDIVEDKAKLIDDEGRDEDDAGETDEDGGSEQEADEHVDGEQEADEHVDGEQGEEATDAGEQDKQDPDKTETVKLSEFAGETDPERDREQPRWGERVA